MRITKRYTFEAHHKLPYHNGKCARDHGHSYILEVSVEGDILPDDGAPSSGMVMDFADINTVVKPLIADRYDHHSINDILQNPTAERMVEQLVVTLTPRLPGLCRVRLYETATAWAEWTR
jgi:6-pyruvoyltetrahydropterin/6-carboxytetrahydropterin synthase